MADTKGPFAFNDQTRRTLKTICPLTNVPSTKQEIVDRAIKLLELGLRQGKVKQSPPPVN